MSNNKSVVGTTTGRQETVLQYMDPYKHLDKLAKSIDNKSQHKTNNSANADKTLIDFDKGEHTTRTMGDTTITYTKEDGWPRAYVTSTSAQVVTIPASFGRRPKTGNKSKTSESQKTGTFSPDETTTKPVNTHHRDVPANRKPTPDGILLKRPSQSQPSQLPPSYRRVISKAIRHDFANPGKGLIPTPTPKWCPECPGPAPAWAQAPKRKEEMEDEDAYRGCGPDYDLHPDDDEHFTDVWYDDGE